MPHDKLISLMSQARLILDVAILTAAAAASFTTFNVALFSKFVPWFVRAIIFGVGVLIAWILLWITPVRYSLEGGVVRLCSPIRCVEYEVEGVEGGKVYNPRMWKEWLFCGGFRGFKLAWAGCPNGHLYFATTRCRDVWKKLQVRKGNEKYTLWLCTSGRG